MSKSSVEKLHSSSRSGRHDRAFHLETSSAHLEAEAIAVDTSNFGRVPVDATAAWRSDVVATKGRCPLLAAARGMARRLTAVAGCAIR